MDSKNLWQQTIFRTLCPWTCKCLYSLNANINYAKSAEECIQDVEFVLIPTDWPEFRDILPKITVPTFVGHRSFVNPDDYENVYSLGFPKK